MQRVRRTWTGRTTRVLFAMLLLLAGSAANAAAPELSTSLQVKGDVERVLALDIDALKRLPVQKVDDMRSVRGAGGDAGDREPGRERTAESARHYVGCLLRDVLEQPKPIERKRHDLRRSVVIATATDGYKAVFSWAELVLSPIGDGVLVIYERDGRPLDEGEGRIALVSLKDTRPGPRHVKWLSSVELRVLPD